MRLSETEFEALRNRLKGMGLTLPGKEVKAKKPKASRKKPQTPKSQVRSALRQLWLRSRERAAAIKREGNTCECCGKKGSKAKGREVAIEVHHLDGIEWDNIIEYIFRHILVDPVNLAVVCKACHDAKHDK